MDKLQFNAELRKFVDEKLSVLEGNQAPMTENGKLLSQVDMEFLGRLFNPTNVFETPICHQIYKVAEKAEKKAFGAGLLVVLHVLNTLRGLLRVASSSSSGSFSMAKKIKEVSTELQQLFKDRNHKTITEERFDEHLFEVFNSQPEIFELAKECMFLSGLEGNMRMEQGTSDSFSVEVKTGYYFPFGPVHKNFVGITRWQSSDTKVLIVNGYIERVSELDKVLMAANTKKEALVIIAQGYSEEVIATLLLNFKNKRLNVMPVLIPPDVEVVNSINDLAVVTGNDIVSIHNGAMLTTIEFDDLKSVEKITITHNSIMFENNKTLSSVAQHIGYLYTKRQSQYMEVDAFAGDFALLIEQRIKTLSSFSTVVKLPNVVEHSLENIIKEFDTYWRYAKAILSHGVSNPKISSLLTQEMLSREEITPTKSIVLNALDKTYKHLSINKIKGVDSLLANIISLEYATSLVASIISCSGAVLQDTRPSN